MESLFTASVILVVFLSILDCGSCQRSCSNFSLAINSITPAVSLLYDASQTATTGTIRINVSWTIDGSEDAIDGFLLKVRSTSSPSNLPLRPIEPCVPAGQHIWLGGAECSSIGSPPACTGATTSSSCICNATCPFYQEVNATRCRGTANLIRDGFTPYSRDVRSAIFEGYFHEAYQADIYIYKREFTRPPSSVFAINTENSDCPALIASNTNRTPLQAVAVCCDVNVTQVRPVNVGHVTSVNLNAATVTLHITWLPPVLQENLSFSTGALSIDPSITFTREPVEIITNPMVPPELQIPCYNRSTGFRMKLTGLLPGQNYTYTIRSNYDQATQSKYCSAGLCDVITHVNLPNITLCDPYFNACSNDPKTVCGRNGTSYVCSCETGYMRNMNGICSDGDILKASLSLSVVCVVSILLTLFL